MSETVPGECRSVDCNAPAVWFLDHQAPPPASRRYHRTKYQSLWHGEFCHPHMLRCLELKFHEVRPKDHLIIERMRWE